MHFHRLVGVSFSVPLVTMFHVDYNNSMSVCE